MPFAALEGIDVYYELHGEGPQLLSISGSGGDLRFSMPDRHPLNKHFQVLSYDQRGLGQTTTPDGPYSMAQYADDAAALLAAVGWERCHVMGTSFGGMVALHLAVRRPDVISRLVLNCTSPGGTAASYPLHELGQLDPDAAFATRMRLYDERWDPSANEPIPGLGPVYELIAESARVAPDPEQLAGLGRQLQARAGHDVVDDLGAIELETLVCAGEFDALAPVANSRLIVDRMPNATLRTFDGGHFFALQDRSAYASIAEFLGA